MHERGTIIVVDSRAATRDLLLLILEQHGHYARGYATGAEAIGHLTDGSSAPADVVIAETLVGDPSGMEVLRVARGLPDPPEVIILAGTASLENSITALRLGAADYLLKPASADVILGAVERAMVRRLERRRQRQAIAMIEVCLNALRGGAGVCLGESEKVQSATGEPALARYLRVGQLTIDRMSRTVSFRGREVDLTLTEYEILIALATAPSGLVSYQSLVRQVHRKELRPSDAHQLIKTHVHNMRRKLAPSVIVNVRKSGYRLARVGGERVR